MLSLVLAVAVEAAAMPKACSNNVDSCLKGRFFFALSSPTSIHCSRHMLTVGAQR